MKILADLSYIRDDSKIGLANFAFNLLEGMRQNGVSDRIVVLTEAGFSQGFKDKIQGFKNIEIHAPHIWKLPFTRGWIARKKFDEIIQNEQIDLVLYCYVCDRSLFTKKVPSIGVLHDIAQFKSQKNLFLKWRFNIGGRYVCNQLSHIVTITQTSKQEILDFKHIKPSVSVIYDSIRKPADLKKNEVQPPYILTVNRLVPYKNVFTLVKAFNLLKDKIVHTLYIKGKSDDSDYWKETILPFILQNGIENRVRLIESPLSDLEIDRLYTDADIFVTTSTMEGFGMTPLEAAMCRTPVISTALPTLVESTRGRATYYEPYDDAGCLAEKILWVLSHKEEMDLDGIKAEYEEACSCKKTAQEFISLIQSVSGKEF